VSAHYADASALLRVLFAEPGPALPLGRGVVVLSSKLVEVEAARALDRGRLTGHLDDQQTARKHRELAELLGRVHLAPIDDHVVERARQSFPVSVRALDALHVATAELLARHAGPLQFWTHDTRQAVAAESRGLEVHGAS